MGYTMLYLQIIGKLDFKVSYTTRHSVDYPKATADRSLMTVSETKETFSLLGRLNLWLPEWILLRTWECWLQTHGKKTKYHLKAKVEYLVEYILSAHLYILHQNK